MAEIIISTSFVGLAMAIRQRVNAIVQKTEEQLEQEAKDLRAKFIRDVKAGRIKNIQSLTDSTLRNRRSKNIYSESPLYATGNMLKSFEVAHTKNKQGTYYTIVASNTNHRDMYARHKYPITNAGLFQLQHNGGKAGKVWLPSRPVMQRFLEQNDMMGRMRKITKSAFEGEAWTPMRNGKDYWGSITRNEALYQTLQYYKGT